MAETLRSHPLCPISPPAAMRPGCYLDRGQAVILHAGPFLDVRLVVLVVIVANVATFARVDGLHSGPLERRYGGRQARRSCWSSLKFLLDPSDGWCELAGLPLSRSLL